MKGIYSYCLLFLSFLKIRSELKEITFQLNRENSYLFANFDVGTPPQRVKLLVDLLSNMTWIAGKNCIFYYQFNAENETVFVEENSKSMNISNTNVQTRRESLRFKAKGVLAEDVIRGLLKQGEIFSFSFGLADYYLSDVSSNGILGLEKGLILHKNSTDFNSSLLIVDSLYNRKIISKDVFYFNNTDLTLTFGKYPYDDTNKTFNYSKCSNFNITPENSFRINEQDRPDSHWVCKIGRMFTGDVTQLNSIIVDRGLIFSTTIQGMIMPSDYIFFFERNYFSGLNINTCSRMEYGNTIVFGCNPNLNTLLLPTINFEIGDWVYTFKPDELFTDTPPKDYYFETSVYPEPTSNRKELKYFKIRFVSREKFAMNYSLISLDMFKDVIVFDKENDEIGFTTKDKVHKQDLVYPSPGMSLVILLIIIIVSFFVFVIFMVVGYVCYIKCKERREANYQIEFSNDADNDQEENNQIKQL